MIGPLPVIIPYFNHTAARVNRRNLEHCLSALAANPDCSVILAEGIWNKEAELPDFTGKVFRHLKFRYPQALWVKENLINLALRELGEEWECAAWVDKDVEFLDPGWAAKTAEALRSADLVQPWSHVRFLGPGNNPVQEEEIRSHFSIPAPFDGQGILSVCRLLAGGSSEPSIGHSGLAWGMTRGFHKRIGGLYDRCVFGGGDRFLTAFLGSHTPFTGTIRNVHGGALDAFMTRCYGARLGCVEGSILHHYHGEIPKRRYRSRYAMAREAGFDPMKDVSHADDGTLRLDNPAMEKAILDYLFSREEHLVP